MAGTAAAPQINTEKDFYRIGEVSRMTGLKPFVLRYWETEFPMLEPVKSASGHRLYRAEDVDMVRKIKRLLYDEGFTIAGARRHVRDPNAALEPQRASVEFQLTSSDARDSGETRGEPPAQLLNRKMLLDLRDSLRAFLTLLERR
jgi:DNA-binding transcriptional MerR regulator